MFSLDLGLGSLGFESILADFFYTMFLWALNVIDGVLGFDLSWLSSAFDD